MQQKAIGVRGIDSKSKIPEEYFAKVIFVTASTLNTNLILLNSISNRFPNELGNENCLMGKYIAFHNYRANINTEFDGFPNFTTVRSKTNFALRASFSECMYTRDRFLERICCRFWIKNSNRDKKEMDLVIYLKPINYKLRKMDCGM